MRLNNMERRIRTVIEDNANREISKRLKHYRIKAIYKRQFVVMNRKKNGKTRHSKLSENRKVKAEEDLEN